LHINKPEIDLEEGIDLHDTRVYLKGAENLKKFINKEIVVQDETPRFYVYKQIMGNHEQTGLVACASVIEYEDDRIKKHEFTRPEKEDDRVNHIDNLNAQVGPVFLTYVAKPEIDRLIEKTVKTEPEYDFVSQDNIRHTLWVVNDEEMITNIRNAFKMVNPLYVADGHHRSAAAMRIKQMRQASNSNHSGPTTKCKFLITTGLSRI
jgi:uncharacterized protein (DUF1015 family)